MGILRPWLRLALALGDQELEQRLRPALDATDELVVVAQCLAADQLVQAVESHEVDAVVVASSLHRLTDSALEQVERSGLPVVLLVADPDDERWGTRRSWVVGLDAEVGAIRELLVGSRHGERVLRRPRSSIEPVRLKSEDRPEPSSQAPSVIAVAGGAGSPGRTTVAVNLTAALGAVASAVLVEVDLDAPALAAYLDRDPSRNLCTLAHAVREDPHAWGPALGEELQPLSLRGPHAWALCGPPKPEMRASITPMFVERLVGELTRRYRYVILDVGCELLGLETSAASHRTALANAHQVLLVSASNLVGLWHARTALQQLERQLEIERRNVRLVLNRHEPRFHHARAEVEWHLGSPVVAVIPDDRRATERAIADQRPLVIDSTSRAGRALIGLAERVHNGKVRLRMEDASVGGRAHWWRRLLGARHAVRLARALPPPTSRRVDSAPATRREGQVR